MTPTRTIDVFVSGWGAVCLRIELESTEIVEYSIFWDHFQGSSDQPEAAIAAAHAAATEWKESHPFLLGKLLLLARDRAMEQGEPDPSGHVGIGNVTHAERRGQEVLFLVSTRIGPIEVVATADLSRLRPSYPQGLSDEDSALVYGSCYQGICEAILDRRDWANDLGVDPVLLASEWGLAAAARSRPVE